MTITMNTSLFPSDLTKGPELAKEDLQEYVNLGLLIKTDNHKEHYAVQPCWINDPASGLLEEINRSVLGRWSNRLNAYVVAVKNIRNYDNSAGINEDHRWLHIDVTATYYTFCPQEGQRLKGEIKKVGHRAAICIIFDVFTATVLPRDETELSTWNTGDDLRFEIISFVHRRKGPIIRAKSLATPVRSKRKLFALEEGNLENEESESFEAPNGVEDSLIQSDDLEESRSTRKEKKKKKKIKIKQEVDDSVQIDDEPPYSNDRNQDASDNQDHDHSPQNDEETRSKKAKKKKKKKSSHDD